MIYKPGQDERYPETNLSELSTIEIEAAHLRLR